MLANIPNIEKTEMVLPEKYAVNYFDTLEFKFSLRDKYKNTFGGYEYKLLKNNYKVIPV